MNEKLFAFLRWLWLFTLVAIVIVGAMCLADRIADGMWPWQSTPEVYQ
jgi:hypothetical protein